jgi:hypothetical protein
MKAWKRAAALLGMTLGAGAVWLAVAMHRTFSSAPAFFGWGSWKDYALLATMVSLGIAVFVVAYCFGFRWGAEPGTAPNGGRPTRSVTSGVSGEPPSAS